MNKPTEPFLQAGLHPNIPMARYVADDLAEKPTFSAGVGHRILTQSEYHARWHHPRLGNHPDKSTAASDAGSVIHACLLGTENTVQIFNAADYPNQKGGGVATGWTNKAIQEARDLAIAAGRIPMLRDDWEAAQTAVAAARNYLSRSELAGVFRAGEAETTALWQDDDDVWCRTRPDWMTGGDNAKLIVDIKTTLTSARPEIWIRTQLTKMGYDLTAVHAMRGLMAITGNRPKYVFLVVEQNPPHGCSLVALSPAKRAVAEANWQKAFDRWQHALETDTWPEYQTAICYAEPTSWEMQESLEDGEVPGLSYQEKAP